MDAFVKYATNFTALKSDVAAEGRRDGCSDADVLREAVQRLKHQGLAAGQVDLRPVGLDEARLIFREYYLEKYGAMEALHRMSLDSRRQRHRILKPATFESHLYRPRRDAKGKLLVSGPERYDFEGVEDGSVPFPGPSPESQRYDNPVPE
ncbi:g2874 [Coccomyxa elongata]